MFSPSIDMVTVSGWSPTLEDCLFLSDDQLYKALKILEGQNFVKSVPLDIHWRAADEYSIRRKCK